MRVNRAVEKLRKRLERRGIVLTLAALGAALSSRAVHAAPHGLAGAISSVAVSGAAGASLAALVDGTLGLLAWAKYKAAGAISATLVVTAAVTTAIFVANKPEPETTAANLTAQTPPPPPREPFTETALFTLNSPVGAVAIQPDGKIVAGTTLGGFFVDQTRGTLGYYSRGLFRLERDGRIDRSFYCPIGRPEVSSAAAAQVSVLSDGRIFTSGTFKEVDGRIRHGHAILRADGSLDDSFNPWANTISVGPQLHSPRLTYSSVVLNDGSIAVMSYSVEQTNLNWRPWSAYRLDSSGAIIFPALTNAVAESGRPSRLILAYSDMPWGPFPEVPLEFIRYAVRLPNGGAIVTMPDRPISSIMRYGSLKRFHKDWQEDTSFTNAFAIHAQSELSLHLQKDGKLFVAGIVGTLNGEEFPGLVRLDENGAIDRSFRCQTENSMGGRVMDLTFQDDGRIIICGFFTNVNGVACQRIARLNSDGSLDETFRTPFLAHEEFNRRRFVRVHRLAQKPSDSSATVVATATNVPPGSEPPVETVAIVSMRFENSAAMVRFTGKPRQVYVLQASEAFTSTNWINIATNQAGATGAGLLRDIESTKYPMRFYRIATE